MGKDIHIDPLTQDIELTNSQLFSITEKEVSTRQRLDITLNAFRGEWNFNINFGIPYLKNANNSVQLLEKGNEDILDLEIKSAILNTEGIVGIESYQSVLDSDRVATITFSAVTESGEIIESSATI